MIPSNVFFVAFVKSGLTLSPVIINRARLFDIPKMSDVAPTFEESPSLLCEIAILAHVLRRSRLRSTKLT